MKIKKLFFAGLALAALVACDKENESGNTLKDGDAYINVKIAYSDPVTKGQAAEPPFYYGTAAEQKINNAYFIFYYADGSFCQYVKKTDLKMNSQGAGASTDKNIEELSDGVVLLRGLKSKQYPVYMSVILNSEDEWIGANIENKSIEEASKAVQSAIATADKNDQVNWTNFMMSSSSFDNSDAVSGYYCTKLKASNFQESEALAIAEGNPVEAYVERLAAKVKVEFAESLGTSGKIGSFTVNGTSKDLYFNVTGWGLNATTKDSYCFKNINTGWTEETLGFKWNDAANFRSYWGKSTNYGTGIYPGTYGSSVDKYDEKTATLNYITYNDLKVGINGNAYCRENTNDPEVLGKNFSGTVTSVLLKAQVTDKEGNAVTLYNFAGSLYDEANYKAAALNSFEASTTNRIWKKTVSGGNTTYTKVTADDLSVVISADGYAHVELKEASNYCFGAGETSTKDATTAEINKLLNGDEAYKYNTGCSFYKEGMMYYNIPIEHLRDDGKYNDSDYVQKEGNYGVVRNHYYIITVNSIRNLGKAVNVPDERIIPNDDDVKNYFVAAKINVLSWKVVRQSVDL
ncbi:MAG: Mfa1 family fimbria major subunit [Candidatus Cryptobacteroides sp.]|nr:Mfa1 family fimbria major subunit [Alistipes sp.]MDD7710719.1 Mfa1 family fimbria major subunit [Alistipes sp.]MDY3835389.1 Mfa1 family fimbria major subunit [Candidatus Cryptobacteroides sp.]